MPSEKPNEASVFNTARKIESSGDREAYLTEACMGDAAIRERVDKLLSAFDAESQYLERPAAEIGATMLTDGPRGNPAASLDAGLAPAFPLARMQRRLRNSCNRYTCNCVFLSFFPNDG